MVDVLGAIAVFLLIGAGAGLAMRRAYAPARYPGRAPRSRAGAAPRRRATAQPRKSWLVTAAKSAGVPLSSDHLHGATAELAGKATGRTLRGARKLARRGGQRLTGLAARRWERRGQAGHQPLMITRRPGPPHAEPDGAGEATGMSVVLSRAGVTEDDLRAGRGWDKLSPADARAAAIHLTRDPGPGGRIRPEDATWWPAYRAAARPGPPPAARQDTPAAPAPPAPPGSATAPPGGDDASPAARTGPDTPADGPPPPPGGSAATGAAAASGPPPARRPGYFEPGDPPWQIADVGTMAAGDDGTLHMDGWGFTDPHLTNGPPRSVTVKAGQIPDPLFGHTLAELHALSHGAGCICAVARTRIRPGPPVHDDGQPSPASDPASPGRARKENTPMRRYSINLEPPSTDAEFLESCVQLGDVLKALAEEVANWAEGLTGLHLPPSVLTPLHLVSEGIEEAATGAADSAKAFEDEFEDARDVASRGMHFTGADAA